MTTRGSNKGPSSGGSKRIADPRAEPETETLPPFPGRSGAPSSRVHDLGTSETDPPPVIGATTLKQAAAMQIQLAEAQRQIAQLHEERATDTDRLAEMLKRLSRTELRARAAEAAVTEAAARVQAFEAGTGAVPSNETDGDDEKIAAAREAAKVEADERVATAEQRTAEAEKRVAEAERRVAEAERRAADSAKRIADFEKRAADADKRAADAEARAEGADARTTEAESRRAAFAAELEQRSQAAADLDAALRGKDEELVGLRSDLKLAYKEADDKDDRIVVMNVGLEKLQTIERELNMQLTKGAEEIAALTLIAAEIETLRSSVDEAGLDNAKLEDELAKASTDHQSTLAHLGIEHEKEVATANREAAQRYDELGSKLAERGREVHQLEKACEEAKAVVGLAKEDVNSAKLEVIEERRLREEAQEQIEKLQKSLETATADAEAFRAAVETKNEQTAKLKAELEQANADGEVHRLSSESSKEEVAQLETSLAKSKSEVDGLRASSESLLEETAKLELALARSQSEGDALRKSGETAKQSVAQTSNALEALERAEAELAKARVAVADHVKALGASLS